MKGLKGYRKHRVFRPSRRRISRKIPQGISMEEIDLRNSIAYSFPGMAIYESDRRVLNGREIDIWIPSRKLGIEYDGLFFHTGDDKDPDYHLMKTLGCEKKGVRLIHIFSDEWEEKRKLVLDLITRALGKYREIPASECTISPISKKEGDRFLNEFCLLGTDERADSYIGISSPRSLLAVMSYSTLNGIEILRYSELPGLKISGGIESCISSMAMEGPITARVDRRISRGTEFLEAGFSLVEATPPNVYYTKDYKSRIPSHKVKLNEGQIEKNGLHPVYDCGYLVFIRKA